MIWCRYVSCTSVGYLVWAYKWLTFEFSNFPFEMSLKFLGHFIHLYSIFNLPFTKSYFGQLLNQIESNMLWHVNSIITHRFYCIAIGNCWTAALKAFFVSLNVITAKIEEIQLQSNKQQLFYQIKLTCSLSKLWNTRCYYLHAAR